ncbi:MAG: zinc-binding dehydrogenase [Bacteroidota bacterium]
MKAAFLVRNGDPQKAFEIRETAQPEPQAHEVCIKVEAFGLNYADVMARLGLYPDAPPIPGVIGYDVCGHIHALGSEVSGFEIGQRVMALTRFGGYAEYACTDARAVAAIPDDMDAGVATALATQCGTAYYCAEEMVRMHEGDHVLVQAAAGGVGTALVQMAKHRGCVVYGTASTHKMDYLREQGVDHPIDYRKTDFETAVRKIRGEEGLDIVFDSLGGKAVKKGLKLLGHGGRMVLFGAATMTDAGKNPLKQIGVAVGFGFYSPIAFIQNSKSIIGVNMLRIADHRPEALKRCLEGCVRFVEEGILKPTVGGTFGVEELGEAHAFLQSRQSMGKIVVKW